MVGGYSTECSYRFFTRFEFEFEFELSVGVYVNVCMHVACIFRCVCWVRYQGKRYTGLLLLFFFFFFSFFFFFFLSSFHPFS